MLISLGTTTCSKAFTLRLVTFIFSSRVRKAACRDAMWISTSRIVLNFYLHFWIEKPPLSRPIWLMELSTSSPSLRLRLGISTPAMFSYDFYNRMVAFLTASTTFPLHYSELTWTSLLRIWPRQRGKRLPDIASPYSSCITINFSWLPWTFS